MNGRKIITLYYKKTVHMKLLKLLFIALALTTATSGEASERKKTDDKKAKYIFLFIGDGMGINQVAVTESYLSYKEGKINGERLVFTDFPYLSLCTTHSNNRHVTCSAAAGTAIASGHKTNNSRLGTDPDGKPLKSIASYLHEEGYNVGIMTTVPINHATPGAFYANVNDRNEYYTISRQLTESGFEFFGGSGFYHYKGENGDLAPADGMIEQLGYPVCYGLEEFERTKQITDHIVFCQESTRGQDPEYYVSDGAEARDIRLAEMLDLCLDFIGEEEPFFIMCEGGNIDWSCHSNKTMSMIYDVLEFEEAVKKAVEFYKRYPEETLIVVTADHETGGLSLGEGEEWRPEIIDWKLFETTWIQDGYKNVRTEDENKELNRQGFIGWSSYHHTGAPVPVYSIGKGAEKFNGYIDNTDIKGKILGE